MTTDAKVFLMRWVLSLSGRKPTEQLIDKQRRRLTDNQIIYQLPSQPPCMNVMNLSKHVVLTNARSRLVICDSSRPYSAKVFSRVVAACSHIFVLVCTQRKVQEFQLPSERKRLLYLLYPSAWDRQLKHLSVN